MEDQGSKRRSTLFSKSDWTIKRSQVEVQAIKTLINQPPRSPQTPMYALQQQPGYPLFAEATYTLQIFDERGMGAGPTPGLMAHSSQNSPCPSGFLDLLHLFRCKGLLPYLFLHIFDLLQRNPSKKH
ncbi:uncharacterized protein PGTG_11896 [Puccinia graminis f. sp. tritici CRL 75-36-700-3]|uniref:Uncharacterized protein n=1 Tax=Puccinia graminis f. sp. tritici (strain CRL 75-36-700-3 / race SCCL) TaxID=418459 RepID=E3KML5_PUCGT|nr:uncharacterized protein PGTG_11896 [Puccinia graminis f. sp. tritici CRL 75-36-700-3]EFP85540.1 hypothetical protein PGTG_11896 [Puccinia graminis f. sp. tritici CRL 75-36-700-3]